MLITARAFRALIWVAVAVSLAANFVDTVGFGRAMLPQGVLSPGAASNGKAFLVGYSILGLADVATSVVSTIGLLFFRTWARPLTVVSIFLQGGFYLLNSYYLTSGIKFALCMLANILTGVVIAVAYSSNLAQRFE